MVIEKMSDLEDLKKDFEDFDEASDLHLWLADVKKEIDFDSREESEGARELVEKVAFLLETHGYQVVQEELEDE